MGDSNHNLPAVIIFILVSGYFTVESVFGQIEVCDDTITLSLSSPNMTVTNPFFGDPSSTLNSRVNCLTTFVAIPDSMQIELRFIEVQTTNYERISIYDDWSSASSTFLIANFRGVLEMSPVVTSSRGGLILIYSDLNNAVNGPGYLAEARIIDSPILPASLPGICGGTMTLTDSRPSISFSSLIYDNGESSASSFAAECTMHINSQSGQEVQAVLDDIQLINEYVRIYDHPSSSDTEFLVTTLYSTEQARATVFSSQGGLTLVYSANQLTSHGRGFRAEVSILDGIPYESDGLCGGVISLSDSTPNHTFTTPLYNNPSMDNVEIDFTLHILSPQGKQVQLMFLDISTTTSETISVYDYPQSSSQRFTYISGSVNVEVIVFSSANGLTVVYLDSSYKYNGHGFKAVASVIDVSPWTFPSFAGGTIDLIESRPNATFYTPFYIPSSNNDVTLDILFHILSPAGSQVLLSFIDIATTSNEKISVYDHPFSMSTEYRVAHIYGLLDTGATFFSTQGGFTVVYDDSSSSSNGPGFRAVARILDIVPSAQSALCGGTVVLDQTTPKLNFSSPLYDNPSFVDVHVDCRIHITSPEGKQVRLNFIYIYTTISESISVYDHPYLLTSRVAFFVGTLTAPSAVYSSSGGLTITYDDGNDLFNGPGYLAEASILDGLPANETGFCGGTMTFTADSPVVTFATPMYDDPSTSDINMDCTMHFVAPSDSHIQLIFSNFATTTSEELVVYDHPSSQSANAETSHLWGPLNSRVAFLSSQEGLTLNYIDGSNSFNGPGFKAEVRLLDWMDGDIELNQRGFCGGTFALSSFLPNVTFSSPINNNPFNSAFSKCEIHITSPLGKQVRVLFSRIETAENEYEQVHVFDNPTAALNYVLMSVNGVIDVPLVVYSSTGGLTLLYDDTRYPDNGKGYSAEAQVLDTSSSFELGFCGGEIVLTESMPRFNFTTPLYKMSSLAEVDISCVLSITSDSGQQVRFRVHNFDSPLGSNFRVHDHPRSYRNNLISTLYGPLNTSVVYLSSEGGLTVVYSDLSKSNAERGFFGEASILDPLQSNQHGFCGGTADLTMSTPKISLSSPLYNNPSTDSLHVDCSFHITSPSGQKVLLTFWDIETTTDERISVYDHPTATSSRIAYLYGTVRTPTVLYSSDVGLTVILEDRSDAYNGPGYAAEASILELPAYQPGFCGGSMVLTFTTPRVTFSTPVYDNPFVDNVVTLCKMYIKAPTNYQVKLTLKDIETSMDKQITVYDHPSSTSSSYQLFHFYGILNGSAIIISTRGGLTLDMQDVTSHYNGKGFSAEARIYDFGGISSTELGFCGGTIELSDELRFVNISSPFFGNQLTEHADAFMECIMHIKAPSEKQVALTFLVLNTTENEMVRVYDHPTSASYMVSSFRGDLRDGDAVIVSSREGITIVYEDDSASPNGPGFYAQAQIQDSFSDTVTGLCGGVMDITKSHPRLTFTTPLYGTFVPSSMSLYCKITITCPPEEHIELTLFDIAVSGQVGIFDVPPTGAGSIVFTCTGILNASTVIFSRHSSLLIDYSGTSDVLAQGRGFTAEARLAGGNSSNIDGFCGGTVSLSESLPSATITTPLYGLTSQFGLHLECTMHITSTPGTQVQLTFIDFETTASEGLAIYDQPLSTYNKIAYFSGKLDVRTTVSSSRGGLTLTYQDDSDLYNGQGYLSEASLLDIQPISLERSCGGYVALNKNVLPRMTITSPLYGTSSPSNVTISCWWFFSNILRDRQIEVVLKNVGISGDERINVYDHPSSQSYLIASLSGPSADSIFTSTRYGLSIFLEDISPGANGGGFIIDARLQGTETTMSPTSSSNMLPTATTDVLSTKGAGEMTQSNPDTSITSTTSTSVSSSTTHALEENGTTPVDNLIGIAAGVASSVAVVILAIAIITLIAIRSRRKRHENGASAASGSSVKPPSPPPRGDGSRSHETTFTYGKDDGSLVDDVGDDHHYSRAVYSAIDNEPGDEEEDHYYMIPQSCEESDVITEGPTYVNDHVTKPRRYLGQHVTHGNDTELV